ncbi:hypothetical protein AHAS_Ahas02G0008500 [Arachis hypogaea]
MRRQRFSVESGIVRSERSRVERSHSRDKFRNLHHRVNTRHSRVTAVGVLARAGGGSVSEKTVPPWEGAGEDGVEAAMAEWRGEGVGGATKE